MNSAHFLKLFRSFEVRSLTSSVATQQLLHFSLCHGCQCDRDDKPPNELCFKKVKLKMLLLHDNNNRFRC